MVPVPFRDSRLLNSVRNDLDPDPLSRTSYMNIYYYTKLNETATKSKGPISPYSPLRGSNSQPSDTRQSTGLWHNRATISQK